MTLQEAAVEADALAQAGSERELADLRAKWADDLESAARSEDFRERAVAFRAIGQFRWRQKEELLRRGLDDRARRPAARRCSRSSCSRATTRARSTPSGRSCTTSRPSTERRGARLAIVCLRNGSPQRETIVLLDGLAEDDEAEPELRSGGREGLADAEAQAEAPVEEIAQQAEQDSQTRARSARPHDGQRRRSLRRSSAPLSSPARAMNQPAPSVTTASVAT